MNTPSFLTNQDLKLLFFGGKGGVGKTTCATATALYLAQNRPDHAVVLVSVDPAHSVQDSLDDVSVPANLTVRELDASAQLQAFKDRHGQVLREIARRGTFLDEDDITQLFDLSLPGLDELFSLLQLAEWSDNETYHTMVVDTAPTGHTLRLLQVPEMLARWLGTLDTLLAKHRYMKKLYQGTYQPDAQDQFLLDLNASLDRTEALLSSERCVFVPVLLAESMSLLETERLLDFLDQKPMVASECIVNRMIPESDCPHCLAFRQEQLAQLTQAAIGGHRSLWSLPLLPQEVRGTQALLGLWSNVAPLDLATAPAVAGEGPTITVTHPGPPLPDALRIVLFAGKGGVGKTTMACATAAHLASQGQPVLVLSTDPAHSLNDVFRGTFGDNPVQLAPNLRVVAPDALAELEQWKTHYLTELEQWFDERLGELDITFDKEVMEQLWQLCPPGVDEIMALTRIIAMMRQHPGELVVVDSAPTGHLLRLLEMPELLDRWLKMVFSILLKYKDLLRLPTVSDRLIELSRDLKQLRKLLANPNQARLCAVTIPTGLAYEETRDLLAACERAQLAVDRLIINLVTSPSDCALCTALVRREHPEIQQFAQIHPQHTLVSRGPAPLGLTALAALGEQLYHDEYDA